MDRSPVLYIYNKMDKPPDLVDVGGSNLHMFIETMRKQLQILDFSLVLCLYTKLNSVLSPYDVNHKNSLFDKQPRE